MERTKPNPENNPPAKKRKKKQSSGEKPGEVHQVLKAPVPLEIVAEPETKKKPKKTKTKKATKEIIAVATKEQEKPTATSEDTTQAIGEKDRKKKVETVAEVQEPIAEASTVEAPSQPPEYETEKQDKDKTPEESASHSERIIWSQEETDEFEGELWGREKPQVETDEPKAEASEPLQEEVIENEEPEKYNGPVDQDTSQASRTTARKKTTPTSSTGPVAGATASQSPPSGAGTSAGGGGGSTPPNIPFTANHGSFGGGPAAANVAPVQPSVANANKNPYRNYNSERRHLVAGILLGGLIEHVRHKRREKRVKATHEKEIKKVKTEQQFQQAEQYKNEQKSKREKTELEQQLDRLNNKIQKNETKQVPRPVPKNEVQTQASQEKEAEEREIKTLPKSESPSSFYEEFKRKYHAPEMSPVVRLDTQELKKIDTEKPAPVPQQSQENIDEPLQVSPDTRVESSAWHRIEVDKKTGKAIEDPEVAYGEEFQNEQHQEQLRQQIAEASMESERVKQNYMPIIDKTATTSVETHDTPRQPVANQGRQKDKIVADALQNLRDKAADGKGIDVALWAILFLIVVAIIALL